MTADEEAFEAKKARVAAAIGWKNKAAAAPAEVATDDPFAAFVPTPAEVQRAIGNIDASHQPFIDMLTMVQKGLTLGQAPNIQGAASALTGGSFSEGREAQLAREQAASENLTVGGVPFGMLPEAAGGFVSGSAYMKPLQAAYPALSGWLGTLLSGGAEGGVYAQGQGQDILGGILGGAAGSALGRAVVSGASKVADMLPSLSVQERAATQLQQQAARAGVSAEDFIPTIQSEVSRLGQDAGLADIPMLRPLVKKSINPLSSTEAMASAYEMSTSPNRNISDLAIMAWDDLFPTPRSVNALGEAKKVTLDEAKAIYESGLNGSTVKFRAAPFEEMTRRIFGDRPTGNTKVVRDAVLGYISDKTPLGPDGKTRLPMTPRDLLEVKDAVDAKVKEITRTTADTKTNRRLFDLSARLNDTLKEYVPEIRQAADIYSGQYAFDAAYESGYALASKGLKEQSLTDLRETVAGFTPTQKAAFAEGWRKAKFESADVKGFEAQFKRVGPTKSNAEMEVIDTIFGPGTGDRFADVSRRLTELEKTNTQLGQQWRSTSETLASPKSENLGPIRQAADLLTMASQSLQNKMLGGAFQGAFGREARAVGAKSLAAQGNQIVDWATKTGQSSEDAIREIERYLMRAQPAPVPAQLGAQAGRAGAAFERSGRY